MSDIARLTPAQLDALRAIDSPTVANAIEEFDIRDRRAGYMDGSIRCIYPEFGEIVGYAFTITFKNKEPGDPPMRQAWVEALEHAAGLPAPRILVAHDATPEVPAALFGEIMCTLLSRLDFVGVITDGTVRDLNEVRELGLQYFAAGVIVSHGQVTVESYATPVTVAGLTVNPGDLLHADCNGVVQIPADIASKVAAKAEEVRQDEGKLLEALADPAFTLEKFKNVMLG
jgi:regulator of RNase E activity RraA